MDPLRDRFGEGEAEHRGTAGEPLRREAGTNHTGIVERASELGEATALGLVEAADQDRHAGRPHRTAARCAERPHGEAGLCSRDGIREDREDEIVADRVGFERRLVIGSEIRGIHGFALVCSVFTDAVPSHERTVGASFSRSLKASAVSRFTVPSAKI